MQVALALHLAKFPEAVEDTLGDLLPNRVTDFLYGLSEAFNSFYTECQARTSSLWVWPKCIIRHNRHTPCSQ